jgi:hypothetical protein
MPISRYYVPENNPSNAHFPGVPQDDIDDERWASIPPSIQADVDASNMYRKTKPPSAKKSEPVSAPVEKEETQPVEPEPDKGEAKEA